MSLPFIVRTPGGGIHFNLYPYRVTTRTVVRPENVKSYGNHRSVVVKTGERSWSFETEEACQRFKENFALQVIP